MLIHRAAPHGEWSGPAHQQARLRNPRLESCLHIGTEWEADIDLPCFLPSSWTALLNQHAVPGFHHTNTTYQWLVYLPALPLISLPWPLGFDIMHHFPWQDLDCSHATARVFISGACSALWKDVPDGLSQAQPTLHSLSLLCLHPASSVFCGHVANTATLLLSQEFHPHPQAFSLPAPLDCKHRWAGPGIQENVWWMNPCHQLITP